MQTDSITLNDIRIMVQIIKVMSARGAIQADEMATVGTLYTKLENFIAAATPKPEPAETEKVEETTEGEING